MRIAIVYRYFWPDQTPYSSLLRVMIPWMTEAGHSVRIITAQPASGDRPAHETLFGAEVERLGLLGKDGSGRAKALNGAWFSLKAFLRLLFSARADLYWAGTMPPVVQALLVLIVARLKGGKFLYQMQDIYPEIALASAQLKPGLLSRLLGRLDRFVIDHADAVTVLGDDMRETLLQRPCTPRRLDVINNFALVNEQAAPVDNAHDRRPVRFVFAGNIGKYQHLEWLVERFLDIDPSTAALEFVGDGAVRPALEAMVAERNAGHIRFHGMMSVDDAFDFVARCDIGVVPLAADLFRYAYPAKTHTYLAAGLKVLAIIEPESQLARSITENGLGACLPSGASPAEFATAIARLVEQPASDMAALAAARAIYHPDTARMKWQALLASV